MEALWGPWVAARVAACCEPLDGWSVDAALVGFGMPMSGWHESVALVVSECAYLLGVGLPEEDGRQVAWFERRPHLGTAIDLHTSGLVLVRASDRAVCVTVGQGLVAESWGGGLTLVRGDTGRYSAGYRLPSSAYLTVPS